MRRTYVVDGGELSFAWAQHHSVPKILRDQTGACWEKSEFDEPYARVSRSLSIEELSSSVQCWFEEDIRRVAD
jgi:hypothetical protein